MQCPNCGESITEGSKFCLRCGQNIAELIQKQESMNGGEESDCFCFNCGKRIDASFRLCPYCEAPQDTEIQNSSNKGKSESANAPLAGGNDSGNKRINEIKIDTGLLFGSGIAGIVLGCLILFLGLSALTVQAADSASLIAVMIHYEGGAIAATGALLIVIGVVMLGLQKVIQSYIDSINN